MIIIWLEFSNLDLFLNIYSTVRVIMQLDLDLARVVIYPCWSYMSYLEPTSWAGLTLEEYYCPQADPCPYLLRH